MNLNVRCQAVIINFSDIYIYMLNDCGYPKYSSQKDINQMSAFQHFVNISAYYFVNILISCYIVSC